MVKNVARTIAFVLVAMLVFGSGEVTVYAQDEKNSETTAGSKAAATENSDAGHGEDAEDDEAKDEDVPDDGLVAINLKGVNIDKVIEFLTELTGKYIIKQKDVNAQITVFSPEKVSKEKAFALVCNALLLEKVAVVETNDTITMVQADKLDEMVIDVMPETTEKLPVGIVRKIIPIRFSDVSEIEELVEPLVSETGSIMAHPTSKNLIVTDSIQRIVNIESVIARIDVLDTDQRQVQITQLKYADATVIAPIVKSVLSILAAKNGAPQAQKGKPKQPKRPPQGGKSQPKAPTAEGIEVLAYKTVNWLIVVAPKDVLEPAKKFVDELDRAKPPELELRVLPIEFADAEDMARELANLFRRRPEKQLRDEVQIESHDRSNALMILSSQENFDLIKNIVQDLDTEEAVQMSTRTYPLEHADASDIAEQMNELYSGMSQTSSYRSYYYYSRGRGEQTRFVPEPRSNSIIAIAKPNEFEKIDELVKQLDVPLDVEQVAPRIYHIKYVDAKELTDVLNEIFGGEDTSRQSGYYSYIYGSYGGDNEVGRLYGKVKFVPEMTTNSIIVTTNNVENFKIIDGFIADLDQFSPDAANTMVVRLTNAKADELADQLNSLFALEGARAPQRDNQQEQRSSFYAWLYGGQQKKEERAISNLIGQVRVVPDPRTNSLTITTAVQHFELLRDLIKELDIESPKVLVNIRLIEITTTQEDRIGTRFSSDPAVFDSKDFDNGISSTFGFSWNAVTRGDGTIKAGEVDISAIVQFLERTGDTKVLSEPTLVVNNNEAADIFVGSEIPFITDSQTTPEGTKNQTFEYRNAGTQLKITPNINQLDKVVMKVEIEASQRRIGETLFGGEILDTRRFNTELAVESGDTMVIGGIIRETEAETIRRFPILGRIPVLSLALSKKDTIHETTELLAFITPKVLRTPGQDISATESISGGTSLIHDWQTESDK